jgi:hypothetical protein
MNLSEHIPFDARAVAEAPTSPGVYLLYCRHRLIYIGRASAGATIRQCLERHLRGEAGRCTRAATEFDYEASRQPVPLYRHYLAVYLGATGGVLPDCNETEVDEVMKGGPRGRAPGRWERRA